MIRPIAYLMLVLILGCGSGGGQGGAGSGSGGTAGAGSGGTAGAGSGGTAGGGTAGAGETLAAELSMGPFTVDPGQEVTFCITRRLPTMSDINITRVTSSLAAGSHHFVVYKSNATAESLEPTPCTPFTGFFTDVPIYIAETAESELRFPAGVAHRLPAGQMVKLEAHYINTTDAPIQAMGSAQLYAPSDTSSITFQADLLIYADTEISLLPGAMATVGPAFHAPSSGTKIFGMTTHTHWHGIATSVEVSAAKDTPGTEVYQNASWDSPLLKHFDPPLTLDAGQGLRFSCTYRNTTNSTVTFGESANDEMCVVWAYYYPSYGLDLYVCGNGFFGPC